MPAGASPMLTARWGPKINPVLAGRALQLGHAAFYSHALQPFELAQVLHCALQVVSCLFSRDIKLFGDRNAKRTS